jgi:hypothetical protein
LPVSFSLCFEHVIGSVSHPAGDRPSHPNLGNGVTAEVDFGVGPSTHVSDFEPERQSDCVGSWLLLQQALAALRGHDWVAGIPRGLNIGRKCSRRSMRRAKTGLDRNVSYLESVVSQGPQKANLEDLNEKINLACNGISVAGDYEHIGFR